jgi:hypothetical protein
MPPLGASDNGWPIRSSTVTLRTWASLISTDTRSTWRMPRSTWLSQASDRPIMLARAS